MLYCDKCKVSIKGHPDFCPLCQGSLTGTPEGADMYPIIRKNLNGFILAVRIAIFITITAVFVCAAVNYVQLGSFVGWWFYVGTGAVCFWLPFGLAYKLRGNVIKSIVFTSLLCCVIAFLWDLCTGLNGWSLDIFLPVTCCLAMISLAIMALILNLRIEQYIYYLIIDIIFGIIPIIFLLTGVVKFIYPSVVCVAASAISLTALTVFQRKALWAEIVRRTHL